MEETVFPRPAVRRILTEKYVEARLHSDHAEKGEEWQALERRYVGYVANPYFVVFDPETRQPLRRRGFPMDDKKRDEIMVHFLEGKKGGESGSP